MPTSEQWKNAVNYALAQDGVIVDNRINRNLLVDSVRKYFDDNNIDCPPMDFSDPEPYIPEDILR